MKLSEITDIISYELHDPDNNVLKEVIKNLVLSSRATLIRREFEKTKNFPESAVIPIKCLSLIEVSSTECCNIDLGCTILRTKLKIPRLIEVKDTINFKYVGSIEQFTACEFGYLTPDEVGYIKYRKHAKNQPYYTYLNDYIYIFNRPACEAITIRGVFADLVALSNLKSCENTPCFDIDDTIPIEEHWEDAISKMILLKLQKPLSPEIKVNDEAPV